MIKVKNGPYDPGTFTNNANSFMACVSFAV